MATAFLVLSIVALLGTANALRPARAALAQLPSFFWSWLTIELAPWWLFWHIVAAGAFVSAGALDEGRGVVALVLTLVSAAGLAAIIVRARKTVVIVGDAIRDLKVDGDAPRFPRRAVWFPFLMGRRKEVRITKNIPFATVAGRTLKLDLTQPVAPPPPNAPRPGLLQIHGGAWVMGDKREQGIPLCNHMAANGWVTINANYRLSSTNRRKANGNPFPVHLQDVKRAIAWYRDHAAEYGADPDFLCVTGGSAGGHLTALVALTAGDADYQPDFEHVDTGVRAAVPFYGIYDFTNRAGNWGKDTVRRFIEPIVMRKRLVDDPVAFAKASPLDCVRADAPPFFVIHGSRDTLAPVGDARAFVAKMREVSKAPVVYGEMLGAQHAFDVFPSFRTAAVIEGVERFLTSVHRAYLAGRTDSAVGPAEVGAELVSTPD